ncbi:MAG: hypothetical protein K2V38_19145, partial [Gemmataceae bacterium]|nr:hypothetical protein [Gemmataceae bacterium]
YLSELNQLPRDLPVDGRTSTLTFMRVFGLTAEDGTPDPAAVKAFADKWLSYINTVPTVGYDVPLKMPEPPKTDPNNPMVPGMGPGAGGRQ